MGGSVVKGKIGHEDIEFGEGTFQRYSSTGSLVTLHQLGAPGYRPWPLSICTDVRDYGALCDGTTDDTSAVLSAIQATNAGGGIYFPGICLVSAQIPIATNNITLFSNGLGGLKLKNNSSVSSGSNWIWIEITGNDVTLRNMVFDGNGTNQTYLYNMVSFGNTSGTSALRGLVTSNIFKNAYGTALVGWKTTDLRVIGNHIKDSTGAAGNPGEGICAITVSRLLFEGNIIHTMADAGVYLTGTNADIIFAGNSFTSCTNAAFNIYSTTAGLIIAENTFTSCGASPISIDGAATVTLKRYYGNTGVHDLQDFIVVTPGTTQPNVVSGNLFSITNSGPVTITNFLGAPDGHIITLWFADTNTTIDRSACYLAGGANYTSAVGSTLTLLKKSGAWYEVCRASGS